MVLCEHLAAQVESVIHAAHARRQFSGAAAAVWRPDGSFCTYIGTHAYGDERVITPGSQFDLASVTKTFTASVLIRLIVEGRIDPDEPVAAILPIAHGSEAQRITLRMLLTHTSGLPATSKIWMDPTVPFAARLERAMSVDLESAPGETFRYSCLGYICAGALAERITGQVFPDLVRQYVTQPLGLSATQYGPISADRAVATEDERSCGRGMVRGSVHDELNWFLGGTAGNAGLFSTVQDMLTYTVALLGDDLLSPAGTTLFRTNAIERRHGSTFGQGFGPRIGDETFMGALPGIGHTGFTGTMWVIHPPSHTAGVLLTNRVHPHRERVDISPVRRQFCDILAAASR